MRRQNHGQALVEFAIVLPLLILLTWGGMSVYLRGLYRDSLDEAAEQAAWAAAHSAGDEATVTGAVARAIGWLPVEDWTVTGDGWYSEVLATVTYTGAIHETWMPPFHAPLGTTTGRATNQTEDTFDLTLGGGS
ncbi:MAG: pilus assembly protein [Blastochloris sp.]|nr:pilus assembly protein [Blastochloris sp.]